MKAMLINFLVLPILFGVFVHPGLGVAWFSFSAYFALSATSFD